MLGSGPARATRRPGGTIALRPHAISVAPGVQTAVMVRYGRRSTQGHRPRRAARSGQPESVPADERAKVVPLWHRVLARLVLRPSIGIAVAEPLDEPLALPRRRVARLAAPIIRLELGRQVAVVVAVRVHGQRGGQPHARPAHLTRVTDAEPRHGKDAGRQL